MSKFKPYQDILPVDDESPTIELPSGKRIYYIEYVKNYYVTGNLRVIAESDEEAARYAQDELLVDSNGHITHDRADLCEDDDEPYIDTCREEDPTRFSKSDFEHMHYMLTDH